MTNVPPEAQPNDSFDYDHLMTKYQPQSARTPRVGAAVYRSVNPTASAEAFGSGLLGYALRSFQFARPTCPAVASSNEATSGQAALNHGTAAEPQA